MNKNCYQNGDTISNKSRIDAVKEAIKQNYQVAIDDGLQDSDIKYDISFICFNKKICRKWICNTGWSTKTIFKIIKRLYIY